MLYPQTIIELNTYFSEETKKRFLKLMNENFDIEVKDIDIYKANSYTKESDFSSTIYSEMFAILEREN